jgi:hypothetical protein
MLFYEVMYFNVYNGLSAPDALRGNPCPELSLPMSMGC